MIGKRALCFIWIDAVVWVAGQEVAERLVVDAKWSFGKWSFEVLAEAAERCVDARAGQAGRAGQQFAGEPVALRDCQQGEHWAVAFLPVLVAARQFTS
jgi:hypothetical protein